MRSARLSSVEELDHLLTDFMEVARLSGFAISREEINSDFHSAPHIRPKKLPPLKQAVYGFILEGRCLKVGQAGPESPPRYISHHYNPRSSESNLAKSLIRSANRLHGEISPEVLQSIKALTENDVGSWIQRRTAQFNILIGAQNKDYELSLLEAFVQCRLRPVFEGRDRSSKPAIN
jgi:hypothetical protein